MDEESPEQSGASSKKTPEPLNPTKSGATAVSFAAAVSVGATDTRTPPPRRPIISAKDMTIGPISDEILRLLNDLNRSQQATALNVVAVRLKLQGALNAPYEGEPPFAQARRAKSGSDAVRQDPEPPPLRSKEKVTQQAKPGSSTKGKTNVRLEEAEKALRKAKAAVAAAVSKLPRSSTGGKARLPEDNQLVVTMLAARSRFNRIRDAGVAQGNKPKPQSGRGSSNLSSKREDHSHGSSGSTSGRHTGSASPRVVQETMDTQASTTGQPEALRSRANEAPRTETASLTQRVNDVRGKHHYQQWCEPASTVIPAFPAQYRRCGDSRSFFYEETTGHILTLGSDGKIYDRKLYEALGTDEVRALGLPCEWTLWVFDPKDHHWVPQQNMEANDI